MRFVTANYPEDDCLKVVRFLCIDIYRNNFIKFLLVNFLLIFGIAIFAQTYRLITIFDTRYLIQYGPIYFGSFFVLVCITGVLVTTSATFEALKSMILFKIEFSCPETLARIRLESKVITCLLVTNSILALIGGMFFAFPRPYDREYMDILVIIDKYAPGWKFELNCLVRASYLVLGLILPGYMLLDLANFIIESSKVHGQEQEENLLSNHAYQQEIKSKLSLAIETRNQLFESGSAIMETVKVFIVLYSIAAILMALSILFFMISFPDLAREFFVVVRVGVICFAGLTTAGAAIIAGQQIEDASAEAINAVGTINWYNFNKENKQIYLIHLTNMRPFRLKFSDNIAVNYELAIAIVKTTYSIVSVLRQILMMRNNQSENNNVIF